MSRNRILFAVLAALAVSASVAVVAKPASAEMVVDERFQSVPTFQLEGTPLGAAGAPDAAPASLAGSRVAAVDDGALVIDEDSGQLIRVDRNAQVTARLDIASGAAQLVYDAGSKRAYVSDRAGDHVVVVEVGAKLKEKARWKTPTEPFGLALAPDGKTLLVTTIADRALVALDTKSGKTRWSQTLSREPRGVAISPDGKEAMVAYLTTGTAERIALDGDHDGVHVALGTSAPATNNSTVTPLDGFVTDGAPARTFARNAFAVRYLGHGLAVLGFQESTPVQIIGGENTGSYGGGFDPPVRHELAFVGAPKSGDTPTVLARIITHQPDSLGWDAKSDRLAVAGYGSDDLLIVKDASQPTVALVADAPIAAGGDACGPDGVAISGDSAFVWCSLSRKVAMVKLTDGTVALGPEVTTSKRSELEQKGLALFRAGNDARISSRGALACASCHPDGRDDGLSWRIDSRELNTPLLAGRVLGTHPYKWDGSDKDLTTSLSSTMRRLGGTGLGDDDVKAISAYLESMPEPRIPSHDRKQVARGKALFDSDQLGCNTCHSGKRFTDTSLHSFAGSTLANADTPSLIGVGASAPYFHDGSAPTLEALLRDTGEVHGMADMEKLKDNQVADLVAYLQSL